MACVVNDSNGRRRVQFVGVDGKKRTVRLGKCPERAAETVRLRVEELQSATVNGYSLSRETALWLAQIGEVLRDRLVRAGLTQERPKAAGLELAAFIDAYIERRVDAKPRTIINLKQARKALVEYFGPQRAMETITAGDADAFRLDQIGKGLSDNTVRRTCGRARQFFLVAIRQELLPRNPFAGMKCAVTPNPSRMFFLNREAAQRILDACPDAQWRLIFALSRFAGLRCPSEHLALRWSDVDWEHNRMTVHSPKTAHHPGKAQRRVPIFPELHPHLLEAFAQAEPGTEFVITRCRDGEVNLRTQFQRILRRAGLDPWPKLFHNLRSTCETELAEKFPLHVVCTWIGNSTQIAAKHYLQVTEEHFAKAIAPGTPAPGTAPGRSPGTHGTPGCLPVSAPGDFPGDSAPTLAGTDWDSHDRLGHGEPLGEGAGHAGHLWEDDHDQEKEPLHLPGPEATPKATPPVHARSGQALPEKNRPIGKRANGRGWRALARAGGYPNKHLIPPRGVEPLFAD